MTKTFARKQSWALAVIALCSLGIIIGSFVMVNQLRQANRLVNHTLEVLREGDESLLGLVDCETAYRGYLITAQDVYLQPYRNCESHVLEHLQKLKALTADNPRQCASVESLIALARQKIEFSANAINLRRQYPNIRGRDVVDLGPGRELMEKFRTEMDKSLAIEESLYESRHSSLQSLEIAMYIMIGLLACMIATAIAWIVLTTRRFAASQAQSRELLTQARDLAVRASELKSQFVANVSHEVRTPLSGVLGMSELLVRAETDSDKKDMLEHIYRSAQSLLFIVNDLLDFSKLEAGRITLEHEPFDLASVVDEVINSVTMTAQSKNLSLQKEIDPQLTELKIDGDALRLRQVLLNLVHNAVKFTSTGSVTVSLTPEGPVDAVISVRFSVKDSGVGFSKEAADKLFQPFVQADGSTSRKFGGTGLGLSICKKIVDLMAGQIGCSSDGEGSGATFWFTVPLTVVSQPVSARKS